MNTPVKSKYITLDFLNDYKKPIYRYLYFEIINQLIFDIFLKTNSTWVG